MDLETTTHQHTKYASLSNRVGTSSVRVDVPKQSPSKPSTLDEIDTMVMDVDSTLTAVDTEFQPEMLFDDQELSEAQIGDGEILKRVRQKGVRFSLIPCIISHQASGRVIESMDGVPRSFCCRVHRS